MAKFVIFASARTGSSSLARLLEKSKGVKLVFEPFNPKFREWSPNEKNYHELVRNVMEINNTLDELFKRFNAMKTLDYQLSEKNNSALLGRRDLKVLFLTRRNLVEQIISDLVAHQTKIWDKRGPKRIYNSLKPIDITEMQNKIDYVIHLNGTYLKFLEKNRGADFLHLFYEDLYSEDISKNIKAITKICKFLEIPTPPKPAIEKYMTPSKVKINYENIYNNLPNYKEIEKKFGKIS